MRKTQKRIFYLLSMALVLFGLFQSAYVHAQNEVKRNISLKNVSVNELVKKLGEVYPYSFFITDKGVAEIIVSVESKNATIEQVLKQAFTGKELTFTKKDLNIVIAYSPKTEEQSTARKQISGIVTDETGEPLIGATVLEKGVNNGTATDADGKFSLSISGNAVLVVSYIGCITQEITVGNRTELKITLQENNKSLGEVVVVGFGTQKKVTLTGAVATISSNEITTTTNSNLANMLTGKLPGIRVQQRTSEPGEYSTSFDIRGLGTPLFVIDGVPRDNFQRMDPNEIESISVLKDASAAVYGVRSSNGVVLITTKKGRKNTTNIDFSGSYGWQILSSWPHPLSGYDFALLTNENALNGGQPLMVGGSNNVPFSPEIVEQYRMNSPDVINTNWENLIMRKSVPLQQYNLRISGGGEKVKYFTNIGQTQDDGIWRTNSLNDKRYNVRSNVSADITDRFNVETLLSGIYDKKVAPAVDQWQFFKAIWMQRPDLPVYANNTEPYYQNVPDNIHPLVISNPDISGYNNRENRIFQGTISASYLIPGIEGLKARTQYSYDFQQTFTERWVKKYILYSYSEASDTYSTAVAQNPSTKYNYYLQTVTTNLQTAMEYERTFLKSHNVKALVLFELYIRSANNFNGSRQALLDAVDQIFAGVDANKNVNADLNNVYKVANQGFVGRLNYDYNGKYLLEYSFRYDGSSKFAKGHQWGFFPAGSLGWRISEEAFIKDNLSFISNMKLRMSYGIMGDDGSSSYQYLTGYNYPNGYNVIFNNTSMQGLSFRSMANPNLTWYTSKMFNAGIDLNLWDKKLGFSGDVFLRNRTGLMATRILSLPATLGSDLAQENLNQDYSKGFEITLNHFNQTNEINYGISGNMSFTFTKYGYREQARAGNSYLNWRNGTEDRYTGIRWGYGWIGQFQNYQDIFNAPVQDGAAGLTQHPGDLRYEDYNGDGVIDDMDRRPIGRGIIPLINFGTTITASWRGFDLNVLIQGGAFSNIVKGEQFVRPLRWERNGLDIFTDRWHRANPNERASEEWIPGKYPSTQGGTFYYDSEWMLDNSSYVRVKSAEIGYTIPKKITWKVNMDNARIYINGFNLLTWSPLDFVDPEHTDESYGYMYPIMRSINFGLNITF